MSDLEMNVTVTPGSEDPSSAWFWMTRWCKENGLAPHREHNWAAAQKAYNEHITEFLIEKMKEADKGRFRALVETFDIKPQCFMCGYFNENIEGKYRCAVAPSCIGVTLSQDVKRYLLGGVFIELKENQL